MLCYNISRSMPFRDIAVGERKTAQFYILQKNINQMDIRFDVIDILEIKPSDIAIEHIQNAF